MDVVIAEATLEAPAAWPAARAAIAQTVAASQTDPTLTLRQVTEYLGHLVGDRCRLRLLSSEGQWLELHTVAHRPVPGQPEVLPATDDHQLAATAGLHGLVLRTGQPQRLTGPAAAEQPGEADTRWWTPMGGLPTHSLLIVPLIVQGRPAGTISLARQQTAQPFTRADEEGAIELAAQAALALEKAHLYRALQASEEAGQQAVSLVAHELRNPLAGISGLAQLLQRRQEYSERAILGIVERTHYLEKLIDRLLDATRLTSGRLPLRPERCELLAIIGPLLASIERPPRPLRLVTAETAVIGWWDRQRLAQLVEHLLDNALAYSPPDSEVVVEVTRSATEALVTVTDQGSGLTPAELPDIFRPFYRGEMARRLRADGLGLGLAIAKGLAEAHGGAIAVSSTPGAGSCFRVTLPLAAPTGTDR